MLVLRAEVHMYTGHKLQAHAYATCHQFGTENIDANDSCPLSLNHFANTPHPYLSILWQ